jgi:cytochrome c-type biogenesis protein CcmE
MDPARKRTVRLVVSLTAAVLLAGALAWTSFSASSEARTPAQLTSVKPGETYRLAGRVDDWQREGTVHTFRLREPGSGTGEGVRVRYEGSVPDPFRNGRDVLVTVSQGSGGTFVGQKGTLTTKCPSKFTKKDTAT